MKRKALLVMPLVLLGTGVTQAASFNAGDTKVTIGGYVKLDAIYDKTNNTGHLSPYTTLTLDDPTTQQEHHHFRMHANETRLSVGTETDTECGKVKTYIETDFFNTDGSELLINARHLQMRRAFLDWNGWLVGQEWTNFQDTKSYPELMDFAGPVGRNFVRQSQVRYTYKHNNWTLAASLENPDTDATITSGTGTARDIAPDVTAHVRYGGGWGHVRGQAVYRVLQVTDTALATLTKQTSTALGFGVSARVNWAKDSWWKGNVRLNYSAGNGIGRYLQVAQNSALFCLEVAGAGRSSCQKQQAYGGYVGVQQWFGDKFRANLAYGRAKVDLARENAVTVNKKFKSFHINGVYSFTKSMSTGLEYITATRTQADDRRGHERRFQASMKLKF